MVHTDSGGIFLSHHWLDFLSKHNIKDSSADSKTMQNQVSERLNRSFKQILRETLNKRLGKTNNKTSTLQLIGEATKYNFDNVKQLTQEIVTFYNTQKPHEHLGMLTPDAWAFQARNTPNQDFLIRPKSDSSDGLPDPLSDVPDQTIIDQITDLKTLSKDLYVDSAFQDIEPKHFIKDMKDLYNNFSVTNFHPLAKNDNSSAAKTIREFRHQIITRGIRDTIQIQNFLVSSLDPQTQEAFRILEAENKKWEETEVRALQTIMLQNQILFTSIEDLKRQLEARDQRIEAQNQTILNQNDYLVQVTQKNEHIKQLAQERKMKRLMAETQKPLDRLTLDEFYQILFDFVPILHKNSYCQSRMKIGLFIMYFTGLRVSNPLIITVRQLEDLIHSEFGTDLLINKQGKGKRKELQTITLGDDARKLLVDVFYDDIITILKDKNKQDAVFSKEGSTSPLHRVTWNKHVNAILGLASHKLNKNLKSHSFRITFATDGLQNKIPLLQMKSMLAHKSVSTTQHYVPHDLTKDELRHVITLQNRYRVQEFQTKLREHHDKTFQKKQAFKLKKTSKIKSDNLNNNTHFNDNNLEN